MSDFKMPSLGADMESATLVEWRVKRGDAVKRGDVVCLIETAKGIIDVEIWEDGVVEEIVAEPGRVLPVGHVLARIRPAPGGAAVLTATSSPRPASERGAAEAVRASPAARKRARELGVDIATLKPATPGAPIGLSEVEERARESIHVETTIAAPPPIAGDERKAAAGTRSIGSEAERSSAMRKAIASAMARSKREIPHYYLANDVDMGRALAFLERVNVPRSVGDRLLPVVMLLKAVALAAREVPELNGSWSEDAFHPSAAVHLGVAIALRGGGLVAPALHDVDRKSLDEIMRELADLIQRTRAGSIRSSELTDPTLTVTNLGERGVEQVFGIVYPPQVALVGFGKIAERPAVVDGAVIARPIVTVTLSADHRSSDGHSGALFLNAISRRLLQPEAL